MHRCEPGKTRVTLGRELSRLALVPVLAALALGCRSEPPAARAGPNVEEHFVVAGATLPGVGVRDVEIRGRQIVAVGDVAPGTKRLDASGRFLVPALIDSHVHLAYLPKREELARGGVAGAVDLASPQAFLSEAHAPISLVASGPMITKSGGYPTQSWGKDGYGLEVDTPAAGANAVASLHGLGARVVKVPLDSGPTLDDATLAAVIEAAHARGMKVAAHALEQAHAARAAKAGVDVLAHTPLEPLDAPTLEAFGGRAVVSTLSAFGGAEARANLKALRARGTKVLYGTDFGNTTVTGASTSEIAELLLAGLEPKAVLDAMTVVPAEHWGLSGLGSIAPGKNASFLLLDADPLLDPRVLAKPSEVWIDGKRKD